MRPELLSIPAFWVLAAAHGNGPHRRVNHGLIGYGIDLWQPVCAFACRDILASSRLSCSTTSHDAKTRRHNDSVAYETSPDCFAENEAYLLSLARCLDVRCDGLAESWELDRFWALDASTSQSSPPRPIYTLDEALRAAHNQTDRTETISAADLHRVLDTVSDVSDQDWSVSFEGLSNYVYVEDRHSQYAVLLITLVIAVPTAVHLLRLVRLPTLLERKMAALLGHSALFGKRHAVPLPYDIGILPTRGQAIFITFMVALNAFLLLTGYRTADPDVFHRFSAHVANRAGILALANLTLMMLCASRNNLAVRFTKWSYSTMLLYHRWIAYICILEALVHATIYFILHIPYLARKFTQAYWNVGVGTVGLMCFIVPLSALPVRKRAYELFIDSHIALSALVVSGCYYHVYLEFQWSRGYENWVFLAAVIWIGDRIIRSVKLLGGGVRTAVITHIDEDYARIDIPGVKASGHAYLYFPGLSWRAWQNHPFSIAASVHHSVPIDDHVYEPAATGEEARSEHQWPLLATDSATQDCQHDLKRSSSSTSLTSLLAESSGRSSSDEPEKPQPSSAHDQNHSKPPQTTGLTFYIRRQHGITAKLFSHRHQTIKVLIEGPYRPLPIPTLATCATFLCIAGGVGISAVLPPLTSHALIGRSVLYWGCRSQALVDAMDLDWLRRAGVEVHVKVGGRWEAREIVDGETRAAVSRGDVIVLTSGPNGMADDVRAAVVQANLTASHTGRGRVRLAEECFSW